MKEEGCQEGGRVSGRKGEGGRVSGTLFIQVPFSSKDGAGAERRSAVSVHSGSTQRRASPCAGLGRGGSRNAPFKAQQVARSGDGKPSPYSL